MIALIALAFIAGSILTGTSAFATKGNNGEPFQEIWNAIYELQDAINDDSDDEPGLTETYVKIDPVNKKVFCDVGDYAVNGGKLGETVGRPINAEGNVAKHKDVVRGWENIGSGSSYVVCVDTTD